MPTADWTKRPDVQQWMRQVLDDLVPKIDSSAITVSFVPGDNSEGDVKYWVELGCSIMLDKPIIAVVHPADQVIPEHLARVCDHVVRLEYPIDDPRGAKQLQDVIERYTSKCDQR